MNQKQAEETHGRLSKRMATVEEQFGSLRDAFSTAKETALINQHKTRTTMGSLKKELDERMADLASIGEIATRATQRLGALTHSMEDVAGAEELLDSMGTAATKMGAFQATIKDLSADFASGTKLMVLSERIESMKVQNRELKKRLRETKQSLKEERSRREQNEDLTEKLEGLKKLISRNKSYSRSRSSSRSRASSRSRSR